MAQFNTYRCCCGFEIQTDPLRHYSIKLGEYYTLCCHKCNDIAQYQPMILLSLVIT